MPRLNAFCFGFVKLQGFSGFWWKRKAVSGTGFLPESNAMLLVCHELTTMAISNKGFVLILNLTL
jgi:hypothetical protein